MQQFHIIGANLEILSIPIWFEPNDLASPQFVHTVHRLHHPHPWI